MAAGHLKGRTFVLGFAELAGQSPDLPDQVQRDLDRIIAAALHARETVRKMMVFARKAPLHKERVDLNALVADALCLLETRCARCGIEVREVLEAGLPALEVDAEQIYQVIINLTVNAVQAMPTGGRLTVTTRQGAQSVKLMVEDTGEGIDDLDRIFDPFYTTKDVGEGTGLGLAVVDGIISSHDGTIEVESERGAGSRFVVSLPRSGTAHG